jgi:predicted acyl esterase
MSRRLQPGPVRNKITIDRGVQVPMRDGAILVADHYAPVAGGPRPTVLMRCPYGRGMQWAVLARPIAERGYHVLLQSSRGTFGSGGQFMPAVDEAADGLDTVAWLRAQPWFSGELAAVGPSYLAFAAWALAADPPPELTALALYISPHDLAAAGFGQGPFELYNLLMWSDLLASQEHQGPLRMIWRILNADRRLARMADQLPVAATAAGLVRAGASWFGDWMEHPERDDPYYRHYSAAAALERVTVPTLLISGFHDFFIEQTRQQYQALRRRGVPASLIIGPWTHMTLDLGMALRETLGWLDAFADGNGNGNGNGFASSPRSSGALVWTSGADQWHKLPDWPPAGAAPHAWYLQPGRALAGPVPDGQPAPALAVPVDGTAAVDGSAVVGGSAAADGSAGAPLAADALATTFRYDPADPTPSVGGRIISMRRGGSLDNSAVEARGDVLTFTTAPLERPVQVAGLPAVDLHVSSDNAYCDIFARLCDVDQDGRSLNLTDQIVRCTPADVVPGEIRRIRIVLTDVSHVFLSGHRIRLQLSGGAHPRFARNLGTGADLVKGTQLAPVSHQVQHSAQYPSALIMPVVTIALPTEAAEPASQSLMSIGVPGVT